ncbi:MAG TPA: histidinol-phosphate transaminase, partial [Puia sp.]|nr:histidinol-phosphate transaminase [Puia sp.]
LNALTNEEGMTRNAGSDKGMINLGSNENPYGISPKARQAIIELLPLANRYSFNIPSLKTCRSTLAKFHGLSSENILLTAGSGIVLDLGVRYFYKPGGNIVTAEPTFFILPNTAKKLGLGVNAVPVGRDRGLDLDAMMSAINQDTQLIYIVNPNNPTGTVLMPSTLKSFCIEASKKTAIMIDEAYMDFLDAPYNESMIPLAASNPNVLVTRTFSKIHGMAGLRMGYVIGHPSRIRQLEDNYFNESQIAICNLTLAAGMASLQDEGHRQLCKQKNAAAREYTVKSLEAMNLHCIPSYTNFLLFSLDGFTGNFAEYMLTQNIILRSNEYLGEKWCRVSIGTMEEMQQFMKVMHQTWQP